MIPRTLFQQLSSSKLLVVLLFLLLAVAPGCHSLSTSTTTTTTMRVPTTPLKIRVVSYNILSSHLASPSHFSTLNPDHLLAANRFPVILSKLNDEMENASIICLQEVSDDWAGSLHAHFANHGYHFVTGLYGHKFNGYMGVAIAWPMNQYKVLNVDLCRLSDHRPGGWPKAPPEGWIRRVTSTVTSTLRRPLQDWGLIARPPKDPWTVAQNRFNRLVTIQLQDTKTNHCFCIGNYHMPCAFYAPKIMTIHAEMAAKHVQTKAENMPYVLAGDWNIKPYTSGYQLLTTGRMDVGDPEYPTPKHGMEWKATAAPMTSAYAQVNNGKEPDFTNNARVRDDDPFIDTLDYIFVSPEWKVQGVQPLPHRDEAGGPFPNLDRGEPSDHVLIAADLSLAAAS